MEAQEIKFTKYGGILYTDEVNFTGDDEITVGMLVFTDDVALIGTRINQLSARHVRPDIVIVRGKK